MADGKIPPTPGAADKVEQIRDFHHFFNIKKDLIFLSDAMLLYYIQPSQGCARLMSHICRVKFDSTLTQMIVDSKLNRPRK